jgi:predicted NUDIX family phosphoesterase
MEKSPLQIRAERLASEFRASQQSAAVIEFAGLPKAGKTSTLGQVYSFLRRCGFRCEVVVERASICPIRDKKHFNFNIWTACTSIAQLLEKTQNPPRDSDPDILFLDRETFDALCWFALLERLARITPADHQKVKDFLLIEDWAARVSGVIAMTASPKDAMNREQGLLPVHGLGGSIMNPTVLKQMDAVIRTKMSELKSRYQILPVNTSSKKFRDNASKTCETVVRSILDWVEQSIQENILSAPSSAFDNLDRDFAVARNEAEELIARFESKGDFQPRRRVEADSNRIQPLPVVVVRNRSGNILRLIRKERDPKNPLHKSATVWAGGHVRREDNSTGHSIRTGALRELQEELRLFISQDDLKLIGAVYVASGERTKKHMAFVYEWRANTDDVQIALCNSEFEEKGGTSLRGMFLPPEEIAQELDKLEDWSIAILKNLLLKHSSR